MDLSLLFASDPSSPAQIALFFLAFLAVIVVGGVVLHFVRSPYSFSLTFLYLINTVLTRLLWRSEKVGEFELPEDSGAVVVCNHRASVDPFFLQPFTPRMVHWMVAGEFFTVPVYGWMLRTLEAIGTRRGGVDTASTRAAIRYAENGEVVGVLPEGRINMTDQFLLPVRPGAIMIALRARVPIIPCYLEGVPFNKTAFSPLLMPAKVKVHFGKPIDLSAYYDRAKETGLPQQLIVEVMKELARLAGHEDYPVELAGRRWKPTAEEISEAHEESDRAAQRRE